MKKLELNFEEEIVLSFALKTYKNELEDIVKENEKKQNVDNDYLTSLKEELGHCISLINKLK